MSRPASSQEQPDQESEESAEETPMPELPAHEIPVPDIDEEGDSLLCDLLICQDMDDNRHLQDNPKLALRFEVEVPESNMRNALISLKP